MRARLTALVLLVSLATATAPLALGAHDGPADPTGDVHHVHPGESIQDAVDAADPGDTVRIHAGTYHQAVRVPTSDLVLEGDGPGATVLDGDGASAPDHEHDDPVPNPLHSHGGLDGIHVTGDDVVVRNLTVRDFPNDGVEWNGVTGFYAFDVHVLANGLYGLNAYDSRIGGFSDSYGTEHADSAFYVGETDSCQCVLEGLVAEGNLIGYSGTGASDVTIRHSVFRDNAAGIVPNVLVTDHHQDPQLTLYVHDNTVVDNSNATASERWHYSGVVHIPPGLGVVIAGGSQNVVTDNVITGHDLAGVAIAWLFTEPSLNEVRGNVMDNPATPEHPEAVDILWDGGGVGNCFSANERPDGSTATFDGGLYWNTVGRPACDDPAPSVGVPSATNVAREVSLLLAGCEPADHLQAYGPCHIEGSPLDYGY